MRSRKTTGGLTCRWGISLSTIVKQVRSIPAPSRVINAIETFGGVAYATSDRHVDLRRLAEVATFLSGVNLRKPLARASPGPIVASLAGGVVASVALDIDDAQSLGAIPISCFNGYSAL